MSNPKLNRQMNGITSNFTNLNLGNYDNITILNELIPDKMSVASLTKLFSGNSKEDKQENSNKKNIQYKCTISSKKEKQTCGDRNTSKHQREPKMKQRETKRCSDTNFVLKNQQERKQKQRENQRSSDTNFVLRDQQERKQRTETRRSSDIYVSNNTRNSIGNIFNYAINTIKNNVSREILDEYLDDGYNHYNNKKNEDIKSEESDRLNDFRHKIAKEGLVTHAAILEFLRKEKINEELLKQQQKSYQQQDQSICSRFINSLTSKLEPENKTINNGFDSHETFLSRATKQSMLSKEDAMFIHDSFRQRKMLQRGSCDEYMYDKMSAKWRKNDDNDKKVDDDSSYDSNSFVLNMIESSNMRKRANFKQET